MATSSQDDWRKNEWKPLVTLLCDIGPEKVELSTNLSSQDVLTLELQLREDVDAAVRAFARRSRWPALTVEESFCLYRRFQFALRIAHVLATPDRSKPNQRPSIFPNPPEDFGSDAQLEWLLIDAWNHVGRPIWQCHVQGKDDPY